jgi:hypothetical protein
MNYIHGGTDPTLFRKYYDCVNFIPGILQREIHLIECFLKLIFLDGPNLAIVNTATRVVFAEGAPATPRYWPQSEVGFTSFFYVFVYLASFPII